MTSKNAGTFSKLSVAIALSTLAMSSAVEVMAQDEAQEITVTGSRIRQTDGMAEPTPVTVVTIDELNNFDPGGTVSEQLDALPQFFNTITPQRNGGSLAFTVGSFLNMRNLGANRTLVLLDGARMAPGDKRGSVNVDTFPTALVRTVDVVTGGASAAYGADALGGVTNFILDREFEGLKVSAGTGLSEYGDGFRYNMSVAGGFQVGERLNIIGSFEARQIDQIIRHTDELDSSWYQRWGYINNPDPNGPARITVPNVAPRDRHVFGVISAPGSALNGMVFNQAGNQVQPFRLGSQFSNTATAGGPEADVAFRAYQGPGQGQEVGGRSLFLAANYRFSDDLTGYAQAVIGRSENGGINDRASTTGITMRSIWAPIIADDNAYLPQYVRDTMAAEGRTTFNLNRDGSFVGVPDIGIDSEDDNTFTTQTYTLGFNYDVPDTTWNVSGSFSMGETERRTATYDMTRVDRMFLAMDAVVHPDTGAIVCRVNLPQYSPTEAELRAAGLATGLTNSRTASDPNPQPLESPIGLDDTVAGCVPFNVFGHGNISSEAIEYIGTDKTSLGIVEQDFAELVATGEIYEGWGYGPISMAAGLTWRESSFSDEAFPVDVDALGPPQNVESLGIRGIARGYTGGSPNLHKFSTLPLISGKYDVWEWFTEFNVPLWESGSGEQRLGSSLAYRQSDYNISGSVEAWKLGLDFQLMEGLRFRATQSQDVREASFSERFDAQGGGGGVDDPVGPNGSGFVDNVAITVVASGNPDLSPETADTTVVGLVWSPQFDWAQGFSIAADWYEVDIADAISQIGQQDVVDRCYLQGIQEQCANIERDPVTDGITRVFRRFFNQDQAIVEGVDIEATYRTDAINFFDNQNETLTLRLLGGKLLERKDISASGIESERLDQYNAPEFTGNLTTTYSVGPLSFQMQGRYIEGGKLNRNWESGVDIDNNYVSSMTWWNGTVRYSSELSNGTRWNVGFNVLNMFDTNPPRVPSGTGDQGAANQYDIYGRRYNLSMNMEF